MQCFITLIHMQCAKEIIKVELVMVPRISHAPLCCAGAGARPRAAGAGDSLRPYALINPLHFYNHS